MQKRLRRDAFLLTLPAVVLITVMTVIPVIAVIQRAIAGNEAFGRLVTTPGFGSTMWNTLQWTVVAVAGALVIGYLGALVLQSRYLRLTGLWRSILLVPWIIPGVVGATLWKWSFSRDYGQINQILIDIGFTKTPIDWLTNPHIVLWALVIVQIWSTAPFVVLLISAGLTSIPAERYEAARLDGAGVFRLFGSITLPALSATTALATLTLVTWALNAFTIIWVATAGGPAGASTILPVLLYQAFQTGDQNLVSAIAILQLVISVIFAAIYVRAVREDY